MLTVSFYTVYKFLNLVKSSYNRNVKHFTLVLNDFLRENILEKDVCHPVFICFLVYALPL